jgi:hypothetical protein
MKIAKSVCKYLFSVLRDRPVSGSTPRISENGSSSAKSRMFEIEDVLEGVVRTFEVMEVLILHRDARFAAEPQAMTAARRGHRVLHLEVVLRESDRLPVEHAESSRRMQSGDRDGRHLRCGIVRLAVHADVAKRELVERAIGDHA